MSKTPEQIKAMSAGPELDALVHELWFGGETTVHLKANAAYTYPDKSTHPYDWKRIPTYSTDGNAMLELKKKMSDKGTRLTSTNVCGIYVVEVFGRCPESWVTEADTEPYAVAQAAVLAKLTEKEKEDEEL